MDHATLCVTSSHHHAVHKDGCWMWSTGNSCQLIVDNISRKSTCHCEIILNSEVGEKLQRELCLCVSLFKCDISYLCHIARSLCICRAFCCYYYTISLHQAFEPSVNHHTFRHCCCLTCRINCHCYDVDAELTTVKVSWTSCSPLSGQYRNSVCVKCFG